MRRRTKKILSVAMAITMIISSTSAAYAAPPDGGSGPGGDVPGGDGPGGGSSTSVTWSGATEYTSAGEYTGLTYASTSADENALLINTSDAVKLTNPTVTKFGGTSASDNYSFYGINSGIMVKGGSTTTITGADITTDAAGANGVFSYGANSGQTNATGDNTTVNISDSKITTTAQGSGGIMTTYGGTTNASNLTITTSGGSSAPIRTDRGGGWVTVDGGTYTSNGLGSPAIYSTADVDVSNATLISNLSEGVCIEGTGSIELKNCDLTANNTSMNGNAQFLDTIMIYQSQSGDASDGTSAFTMTGGSLTSKNGDVFHVTNTTAVISLNGVKINNQDSAGVLLSVCDDGWSGASNVATLNAEDQTLEGTLLVGSDSTLNLNLSGSTSFTGNMSGEITNDKSSTVSSAIGNVAVTMSGGNAVWNLTADSTVSSISGSGKINYNGHTLTVGSTKYTAGSPGGNIEETTSDVVSGYTITFDNDEGVAGIDVYYTQDYTTPSEKNITTAIARNGDTGEVDVSGDGQINFLVRLNDGYSVSSVSADANYKNVKGPGDTNVSNTYRITKISGNVNVTVKTVKCSHADISNPTWKWDDDCSKAAVTFDCADCNNTVTFEDTAISSVLNEDKTTITFTATYESSAGVKYTDTKTANAYVATFDVSNATVDVYYKQDYTKSDETGVESAIVRDGDSGNPVIDGKGQVNFKVTPAAGYEVAGITVTDGTYKNIKTSADDETIPANTYRITKITGNTTITVNVKQSSQEEEPTTEETVYSITNATVTGVKSSYTYNGKKQTPTPKVVLDGVTLVKDTDYTVAYSSNKNVGTATVTIKGIGNYTDQIEVTFKITKAKNPVTLNKVKVTLKTKTDLSKAKKLKISVKNAQGKVTYSVNKKATSAKIKVTAKGVVTVPKKCKKGTYKITVSAKGNKNYKSGKVVYTIVVK